MGKKNYDLIVNAPNIRTGGGLILFQSLVSELKNSNYECLIIANETLAGSITPSANTQIRFVSNSLVGRIWNEVFLYRESSKYTIALMFGNLPPLFKLKTFTVVFLQNTYIINQHSLEGFHFRQKFRINLERSWFSIFKRNVDKYIVQGASMRNALAEVLSSDIVIYPFMRIGDSAELAEDIGDIQFLYPASGEPHKNHRNLILAWILLAHKGHFPSLHLTLDESLFPDLAEWINFQIDSHHLRVVNLGYISDHSQMLYILKKSKCLIFPSTLEAFGMPLLEAQYFDIPILASELDFVRDFVVPNETFDPESPLSISRSVDRFLGFGSPSMLGTPSGFIARLFT